MHEEIFNMKLIPKIKPGFWFMFKLRFLGKKIIERHGTISAVFYVYKRKLYLTHYGVL